MTTPARTDWSKIVIIFGSIFAGLLVLGNVALFVPEVAGVMIALIVVAVYFVPMAVAAVMSHRQLAAIAVLNLLAGWTVLGWIGALVWAFVTPAPPLPPAGYQHEQQR